MISKAIAKYIDSSPQKTRLVADMIRGRSVNDALSILTFSKKRAAGTLKKLLKDAVANAENAPDAEVDVDDLYVSTIQVDGASLKMRKRTLPAPMGRAFRVLKRQSHVLIELDVKK